MNTLMNLPSGAYTILGALISVGTMIIYQMIGSHRERQATAEANRRRVEGAALLVWDELRANVVQLEIARETNEIPNLESQSYQDLQTDLARGLPMDVMNAVRAAYVFARVPRSLQRRTKVGEQVIVEPNDLTLEALGRARRARDLLRAQLPPETEDI